MGIQRLKTTEWSTVVIFLLCVPYVWKWPIMVPVWDLERTNRDDDSASHDPDAIQFYARSH